MPKKPATSKNPHTSKDIPNEESTPKRKKRYYNNPQNKKVRAKREIRGQSQMP